MLLISIHILGTGLIETLVAVHEYRSSSTCLTRDRSNCTIRQRDTGNFLSTRSWATFMLSKMDDDDDDGCSFQITTAVASF